MKRQTLARVIVATLVAIAWTPLTRAATITAFNFEGLPIGINNSPPPTTGTGTATPLGMTNNLTTPSSVTAADVLNNPGSSTASQAWRIRGAGTGSGNGWHSSAPQ